MARIEDVRGKIPPEVEERLDHAVQNFRDTHKHPANLALHGAAVYVIAKGAFRILRGRLFRGLTLIGIGIAMILAGHEVEKSDSFSVTGNGSSR